MELLNKHEVKEMLGCGERALNNMVARGELPRPLAFRGPRRWIKSEVLAAVERAKR